MNSGGIEYVELPDVRRSPFRVAVTPVPSLSIATREAVSSAGTKTPRVWRDAIAVHLRTRDGETLAPLATPGPKMIPSALLGLVDAPGESFCDAIERMLETPLQGLADEIDAYNASLGDGTWDQAARDPARWLRRYATALLRAWKGFEPIWRSAQPALDREAERIGAATARDAQLHLLDGLLAAGAVRNDRWCVNCTFHAGQLRFPDSGLVLMPLVAGEQHSILTRTEDIMASVGYPLPTLAPLRSQPAAAALVSLLGVPRCEILRAAGDPTSIGALADRLRAAPSAATHHVSALEAAGLVERYRHGRHVFVRRTARAEA